MNSPDAATRMQQNSGGWLRVQPDDGPVLNKFARFVPSNAQYPSDSDREFYIPLTRLAGSEQETWWSSNRTTSVRDDDLRAVFTKELVLVESHEHDGGRPRHTAKRIYTRLLRYLANAGYPHIVKAWNYIPDINSGKGDEERYKQFCLGRAQALEAEYSGEHMPAGTGVGCVTDTSMRTTILASKHVPSPMENPRQVSAFLYPRQYGPKSPSFSRAVVIGESLNHMLFLSGTASIVGHASRHASDVSAQIKESLKNLSALFQSHGRRTGIEAVPIQDSSFRVYLRRAKDLQPCLDALSAFGIPLRNTLIFEAEICRRELLFEIDGIIPFKQ